MATRIESLVQQMPKTWATAPIYRKGAPLPSGGEACGKSPLGRAHHDTISPAASAVFLETQPDTFGAIGAFAGARSNGLVILDVDANLSALKRRWKEDLENTVCITSPKKNAAKYLYYIPQEHWASVAGVSLAASKEGYEILWGRQGVLVGAYHAGGEYKLTGDLQAIPEAPEWLLARMQLSFQETQNKAADKKPVDSRYARRTREERVAIAEACLSVIPAPGRGSEDLWWRIGAMLHSELPGDEGLNLWREWSLKDEEYADDWADGKDPCFARWSAGFSGRGGLGFGSLVTLADHHDPARERFNRGGLDAVVQEVETAVQRVQTVTPDFDEVIAKAKEILELDNPAQLNFEMHSLAQRCGLRDQAALERIVTEQLGFEKASTYIGVNDLYDTNFQRDYLIPEVLPTPAVLVLYGSGGDGKSMAAWTIAKHIALGMPFVVRGRFVPVRQGPVLVLNGDQPLVQLQEQLQEVEFPADAPLVIQSDWSLQRYAHFVRLIEKLRPSLVIIDSLIGCSGGKAFDENKSDFATPLYWLTRNNGKAFPPTTILVIHHANKQGGFRGTTAIRDAVDEVWQLRKPTQEELHKAGENSRIITVEKSRAGRSGAQLLMRQEEDLTFRIADWTQEEDSTRPGSITDKVLARLRVVWPASRTRAELNSDPLVGGNVKGIHKALNRLEKRGLVESHEVPRVPGQPGKPQKAFKAVLCKEGEKGLTRGGRGLVGDLDQIPSAARDLKCDTTPQVSHLEEAGVAFTKGAGAQMRHLGEDEGECRISNPSPGAGSAPKCDTDMYPHACAERTREELDALADAAWSVWDSPEPVVMTPKETLQAISDVEGCLDVSAEEV
jgi:hypothetical protein